MSEDLVLIWFFNPDCDYCIKLEPDVVKFAQKKGAKVARVLAGVIDPESGEPQVPAIMYTHPSTKNHLFVGRFCLDALRYQLEQG